MGQDPSQNIGTEIRISFLTSGTERISLRFSVKQCSNMNMHPLDRACIYNLPPLLSIGKESFIEKVSFEKKLHNHLRNPGYSHPWLIFSKPLRNVVVFLLWERSELCLWRTTFLSMGEHFLIPILSLFLELNSC